MQRLLLALLVLSLKSFAGTTGPTAPKVNIVKGCLCLDCPYVIKGKKISGIWKAKKETSLLATPGGKHSIIHLHPGEEVVALGGEVHITPGELKVVFGHGRYNVGDKIYIIQEDADAGVWKVTHKGKEIIEDLSDLVGEKSSCKKPSEKCWAKVNRSLTSVWWVNLQTLKRKVGWTKNIDDFEFDRSSCM